MYVSGKMRPIETVTGTQNGGGGELKNDTLDIV
jgi:hypothetical protein